MLSSGAGGVGRAAYGRYRPGAMSAEPRSRPTPPGPVRSGVTALLGVYAGGFAMGAADIVPGVSGGTVALVIGIYERLVTNIRAGAGVLSALIRLEPAAARRELGRVEWEFLVPLLGGILTAVALLAGVLHRALESNPVELSALFFGLIVGSVAVGFAEVKRLRPSLYALAAAAAVVTFVLLGFRTGRFTDPSLLVLFGGGALAVCAMILPGISGSFLLLIVGLYEVVIAAVDDRALVQLAVVATGAAIGLGAFSTLLDWLLRRYHDRVLAVLIGLMAGSLRVLWPWPPGGEDGIGETALAAPVAAELPVTTALAVAAAVGVVVLGFAGRRLAAD